MFERLVKSPSSALRAPSPHGRRKKIKAGGNAARDYIAVPENVSGSRPRPPGLELNETRKGAQSNVANAGGTTSLSMTWSRVRIPSADREICRSSAVRAGCFTKHSSPRLFIWLTRVATALLPPILCRLKSGALAPTRRRALTGPWRAGGRCNLSGVSALTSWVADVVAVWLTRVATALLPPVSCRLMAGALAPTRGRAFTGPCRAGESVSRSERT